MAEWNDFLKEYLEAYPHSYHCISLGYSNPENLGELFAVANADTLDNEWQHCYADPYEVEVEGKSVPINETELLKTIITAVGEGKTDFQRSLYLGGNKYHITATDTEEVDGNTYVTLTLAGQNKGGAVVSGPTYLAIGLFEEKREQNKGSCRADTFRVVQAAHAA